MSIKEAERYLAIAEHDFHVLSMLINVADDDTFSGSAENTTDWQVTLLYYILCIQLKALACTRSLELQDHFTIKKWINAERDLLQIARTYRKIEEWSRDARYEGRYFTNDELKRYLQWFEEVHKHLGELLQEATLVQPASIDIHAIFGPVL